MRIFGVVVVIVIVVMTVRMVMVMMVVVVILHFQTTHARAERVTQITIGHI
jgi:hypothetical protein